MIGATYVPMVRNIPTRVENTQVWALDLISFTADPDETARSTSWHVLQLFSTNHMTTIRAANGTGPQGSLYCATGFNDDGHSYLFKGAVNNSTGDFPAMLHFDVRLNTMSSLTLLTVGSPFDANVVGGPKVAKTSTATLEAGDAGTFGFSLLKYRTVVFKTIQLGSGQLEYPTKSVRPCTFCNEWLFVATGLNGDEMRKALEALGSTMKPHRL